MFRHVVFKEMAGFSEEAARLLSDSEFVGLQKMLALDPEKGDIIPHTGGARKVRVALSGRGKRGGGRVVYYYQVAEVIHFLFIYAKNVQEDLSSNQMKWARNTIEKIKKGEL